MSEMLDWLKEYLRNTPIEEVKKEWGEVESLELRSPNAYDYINLLHDIPCGYISPTGNIETPQKWTPKFFGVHFFCLNLHHERTETCIL